MAGAALALLAREIAAPSETFASCGDYVIVSGKPHAGMSQPGESAMGRSCRGPNCPHAIAVAPPPLPPALPCHGPNCSRAPDAPPLLPVTTSTWTSYDGALPSATTVAAAPEPFNSPRAGVKVGSVRRPTSIYRPPRFSVI